MGEVVKMKVTTIEGTHPTTDGSPQIWNSVLRVHNPTTCAAEERGTILTAPENVHGDIYIIALLLNVSVPNFYNLFNKNLECWFALLLLLDLQSARNYQWIIFKVSINPNNKLLQCAPLCLLNTPLKVVLLHLFKNCNYARTSELLCVLCTLPELYQGVYIAPLFLFLGLQNDKSLCSGQWVRGRFE